MGNSRIIEKISAGGENYGNVLLFLYYKKDIILKPHKIPFSRITFFPSSSRQACCHKEDVKIRILDLYFICILEVKGLTCFFEKKKCAANNKTRISK